MELIHKEFRFRVWDVSLRATVQPTARLFIHSQASNRARHTVIVHLFCWIEFKLGPKDLSALFRGSMSLHALIIKMAGRLIKVNGFLAPIRFL